MAVPVEMHLDPAASNTGYQSAASNTGDYSAASNTGNRSAASNTGDYSAASNTGYQSAASNTGYQSASRRITASGYSPYGTCRGLGSAAGRNGSPGRANSAAGAIRRYAGFHGG